MATERESLVDKLRMLDPRRKTHSRSPTKSPRDSPKQRNKSYSVVSLSEVTEGSLQVWRALPEKIRQDPSLASFRQEHDRRLHGEYRRAFDWMSAGGWRWEIRRDHEWYNKAASTKYYLVTEAHVDCGNGNDCHRVIIIMCKLHTCWLEPTSSCHAVNLNCANSMRQDLHHLHIMA